MTRTIISEQGIDVESISNKSLLNEIEIRVGDVNAIKQSTVLKNHCPNLYGELIKRTHFLDQQYPRKNPSWAIPFKARLYCLKHDIIDHPICQNPECSNPVGWGKDEFVHHCCTRCSSKDPVVQQKLETTNLKIFGVKRATQSKQIQLKTIQTNIARRGVPFSLQSKEVKEKSIQTSLKNYGTTHPMKCRTVKDKLKQSMLDIYGVEHQSKLQSVKDKIRKTTNERYGVDCVLQLKEVIAKSKNTMNDRYGVEYPFQSQEIRDRCVASMNERYGVDYYVQSIDFIKSLHKPYINDKYPNQKFGSRWEFIVFDFLTINSLEFDYQPKIRIQYLYDNASHYYHPDFIVQGKIVEVKGDHFFKKDASGNEIMICPYGYNEFSPEEYQWWCGLYEAKHQCMLANNVTILRSKDIANLSLDMFSPLDLSLHPNTNLQIVDNVV